jgi:hypothetical protein
MRGEKLDEAHVLNVQAISLDPGNLVYRLNASSVLMTLKRYEDADRVLRAAANVPKNPEETAALESRLKQVETIQALGAKPGSMIPAPPTGQVEVQTASLVVTASRLKHPTEPPNGPQHKATGILRSVQCEYPSELEFQVNTGGKPVSVYSNDYFKIDLTAVGFTTADSLNPCKDFEGMKARVQYAESSDKSIDGQVIAVELRK